MMRGVLKVARLLGVGVEYAKGKGIDGYIVGRENYTVYQDYRPRALNLEIRNLAPDQVIALIETLRTERGL